MFSRKSSNIFSGFLAIGTFVSALHADPIVPISATDPGSYGNDSSFIDVADRNGTPVVYANQSTGFHLTVGKIPTAVGSIQLLIDGKFSAPKNSFTQEPRQPDGIGTYQFDLTGFSEGFHSFTLNVFLVNQNNGVVSLDGGNGSFSILGVIDHTPPTCTYIYPPTPDDGSWESKTQTLQIRSEDDLSGVQSVNLMDPADPGAFLPYLTFSDPYWILPNYDTRSLRPDAMRQFLTYCRDRANNVSQALTTMNVDNTVPTVTLGVTPTPIDYNGMHLVRGMELINTTSDDGLGSGVVGTLTTLDGATLNIANLNTGAYADGRHILIFSATDRVNNTGTTSPLNLTFDNSAPIITAKNPADGDTVSVSLSQVQLVIDEANGVDNVQILIDGTTYYNGAYNASLVYPLNPVFNTNGIHSLIVNAKDTVGNAGVSKTQFVLTGGVGGSGPFAVKFVTPKTSQVVGGTALLFKGLITGGVADTAHFKVNGVDLPNDFIDPNGIFFRSVDTTGLPEGSISLTASAQNAVSGEVQDVINVTVDNTAPSISVFTPADNTIVSGTVIIEGDAQDTNLARMEIYDGANLLVGVSINSSSISSLQYSWDTTQTSVGTHALKFKVTDLAGNVTSQIHNVTVAAGLGSPLPTITFITPTESAASSSALSPIPMSGVRLLLLQVTGNPSSVGFTVDNGPFIPADPSNPGEFLHYLITTDYGIGYHAIKALATNNTGTVSRTFQAYIDNVKPTLGWIKPSNNQILFFTQNIRANVSDNSPMPLSSVRFYLDGSLLALFEGNVDINNTIYSKLIDTTLYTKGDHQLMVVGYDKAGNSDQASVDFTIDNDNPPTSNAGVNWTPAQTGNETPFVVGPVDTVVTATIYNGNVDPQTIDNNTLKVFAMKDGAKFQLSGSVQLSGNTLKFIGVIPYNAEITAVLSAIDLNGKLIRDTHAFISGADMALGITVKYVPDGVLNVSFPSGALPSNALIKIIKLDPSQSPPMNSSDETIYGPLNLVATDPHGVALDLLNSRAQMVYTRNVAQIPPAEQSFVDRAEQYLDGAWHILGNNGGSALGPPSGQSISVPIQKFGVYRITTAPAPGDGITELFNYPNPFSPSEGGTDFSFLLSQQTQVHLLIYDLLGNLVIRMDRDGFFGQNTIHWDGHSGQGSAVANGGYIALFTTNEGAKARHKVAVAK